MSQTTNDLTAIRAQLDEQGTVSRATVLALLDEVATLRGRTSADRDVLDGMGNMYSDREGLPLLGIAQGILTGGHIPGYFDAFKREEQSLLLNLAMDAVHAGISWERIRVEMEKRGQP